jgi:hypothetical protein
MDEFLELVKKLDPKGEIFTESVLKEFEVIAEETHQRALVAAKEQLTTEHASAITKLEEEWKVKLEDAIDTLDKEHTEKLDKLVDVFTEHEIETVSEAVDEFLNAFVEKALPEDVIKESVSSEKLLKIIGDVRDILMVTDDKIQKTIEESINDYKTKLEKREKEIDKLMLEHIDLKKKLDKHEVLTVLTEKTADMPETKKQYVMGLFKESVNVAGLEKKIDEAVAAYDSEQEDKRQKLVEESTNKGSKFKLPQKDEEEVVNEDIDVDDVIQVYANVLNNIKKIK